MKKQYQRSAANAAREAKNNGHRADLIGLDFRMIATTPEGGKARAVFPAGTPRGALDDFLRKAGSAILEKERCSGKNTPPCSPVGNFSDNYIKAIA